MHDPAAAFYLRFRRIPAALAEPFKMRRVERGVRCRSRRTGNLAVVWDTGPFVKSSLPARHAEGQRILARQRNETPQRRVGSLKFVGATGSASAYRRKPLITEALAEPVAPNSKRRHESAIPRSLRGTRESWPRHRDR